MTPDDIRAAGEKLYGARWRAPLAEALGIGRATLWRWTSGRDEIPVKIELAIQQLAVKKKAPR